MIRSLRIDWISVILAVVASLIGIMVLFGGGGQGEVLAAKKIVWLIIGLIFMFAFAFFNYQQLGSFAAIIYAVGIFLLLVTLVPFIGAKVKGARSWIKFFGMGFQPAEFMKLILVIALSKYLVLRESEIGKLKELVFPFIITAIPTALIVVQPDLGGAVMFLAIMFIMLFIGGANTSVIIGFAIIGFVSLFIPMYLEYSKYILVEDIYQKLKDTQFRVADAVRILNFEVWEFVDNPEYIPRMVADNNLMLWASKIMSQPENLKIFKAAALEIEKANPSLLRDFLSNTVLTTVLGAVGLVIYGLGTLGHFMTGNKTFKSIATFFLIVGLSFSSALAFEKLVNFKPHQVVRVVSFANPDKFPKGAGYQLRHSLITVGSGQFAGKGLFHGDMTRGETPYLPEWHNDFIFSVVGEQLGFWGSGTLLLCLFGLVFRGVNIAIQSKDDFGALLAAGISVIFFLHLAINVGIALGMLPVTGIPLSFVSYGGSNMLVNFIGLGILLNINMRRFINA